MAQKILETGGAKRDLSPISATLGTPLPPKKSKMDEQQPKLKLNHSGKTDSAESLTASTKGEKGKGFRFKGRAGGQQW